MANDLDIRRSLSIAIDNDEEGINPKHSSMATQRLPYQDTLDPTSYLPASSSYSVEIAHSPVDADRYAAYDIHNKARAALAVPPLELDTELILQAQSLANLYASKDGGLQRPFDCSGCEDGISIAHLFCSSGPMAQASKLWEREKCMWENGKSGRRYEKKEAHWYGHFTQMVWSQTTHMGIAAAQAESGRWYVVAKYRPPGNRSGEQPYPVLDERQGSKGKGAKLKSGLLALERRLLCS